MNSFNCPPCPEAVKKALPGNWAGKWWLANFAAFLDVESALRGLAMGADAEKK